MEALASLTFGYHFSGLVALGGRISYAELRLQRYARNDRRLPYVHAFFLFAKVV
jgi:hypothetical protein